MIDKLYEINATAIASERYIVAAQSPEAAKAKLAGGEWESFRDLGHDDMDIIDVKELQS